MFLYSENLALRRPTYFPPRQDPGIDARMSPDIVNDGLTETCAFVSYNGQWWMVELDQHYQVEIIKVLVYGEL